MKLLKLTGLIVLIVLIAIQFFPAKVNQGITGSPDDFITGNQVPPNIAHMLKSACYNCHSNQTEYPWYSKIQPVGWFIGGHIKEGKEELNLSEFGSYPVERQKHKIQSMIRHIEKGEMPLPSYKLMHPEARLSEKDKTDLISFLKQLSDGQVTNKQ